MRKTPIFSLFLILTILSLQLSAQKAYKVRSPEGKYGFFDKDGNEISGFVYDDVAEFNKGIAKVRKGEFYGFVDKSGTEIIPCIYEYATDLYRGNIKVYKDGKIAFMNKKGEVVFGWYDYIGNVDDHMSMIRNEGKYAFIDDLSGKMITDWYDYLEAFSEGKALVGLDGKYFYINKKGKKVSDLPIMDQ